jgi:hypothetical protein
MIALPRSLSARGGASALHFEPSGALFVRASPSSFDLVMSDRLCFSGATSDLPECYEPASICFSLRRAVGRRHPRRLQFDERSRTACVETRDSCFVGAACVGYIELSATHDSVRADATRSGLDGVAGRLECVARDAHAFGLWIDREGAAVIERRWRRARTRIALRYREVHDLKTRSASTKRSRKSKTPQAFRLAGFLCLGGEGGIRTHGTGKPYA